jgi:hypothetical protein
VKEISEMTIDELYELRGLAYDRIQELKKVKNNGERN